MPYTKNTWQSGDIITKVKLDHMEDGIYDASNLLIGIINYSNGSGTTLNANARSNIGLNISSIKDFDDNDISAEVYANWNTCIFIPFIINLNSKNIGISEFNLASPDMSIVNPTGSAISISASDITVSALIFNAAAPSSDGDGR